jgi:hypothetical protein
VVDFFTNSTFIMKTFLKILTLSLFCFLGAGLQAQEEYTSKPLTAAQQKTVSARAEYTKAAKTYGAASWKDAVEVTYKSGLRIFVVPLQSSKKKSAGYQYISFENTPEKEEFVMEVYQAPLKANERRGDGFTGTVGFFMSDGAMVHKAEYKNNEQIKISEPKKLPNARIRWGCVAACLKKIYDSKLGKFCVSQCVTCFATPGWVTCPVCAICLIGSSAYCISTCK